MKDNLNDYPDNSANDNWLFRDLILSATQSDVVRDTSVLPSTETIKSYLYGEASYKQRREIEITALLNKRFRDELNSLINMRTRYLKEISALSNVDASHRHTLLRLTLERAKDQADDIALSSLGLIKSLLRGAAHAGFSPSFVPTRGADQNLAARFIVKSVRVHLQDRTNKKRFSIVYLPHVNCFELGIEGKEYRDALLQIVSIIDGAVIAEIRQCVDNQSYRIEAAMLQRPVYLDWVVSGSTS